MGSGHKMAQTSEHGCMTVQKARLQKVILNRQTRNKIFLWLQPISGPGGVFSYLPDKNGDRGIHVFVS